MKRRIYLYSSIFVLLLLIFATSCKKSYTVKFMVDETVIKEENVKKGESATAPTAEKAGYTFKSWDKEFNNVAEDLIVKAVFEINKYTVTFKVDGEVFEQKEVSHGGSASSTVTPTKDGYIFKGWDKELNNITSNLETNALFEINKFTVTFKIDEEVVEQKEVQYGDSVTPPTAPEKVGFVFKGWDKELNNITGNLEVNAVYEVIKYAVVYKVDGEVYQEYQIEHGAAATIPTAPTKTGYAFKSWDKEVTSVTQNVEINAVFEINKYTVTFKVDEEVYEEYEVEYGKSCATPEEPSKVGHTFKSWDQEFTNVQADLVINAVFEINKYTVTFKVDGDVYKEYQVEHGATCPTPTTPTKTGYTFKSWDQELANITTDLTINGVFEKRLFTVKFFNVHGDLIKEETVKYEESATAPTDVEVDGYQFVEWNCDFSCVRANLSVTGIYKMTKASITYYDGKEKLALSPSSYEEGDEVTLPTPVKEGYEFLGWYLSEISLTRYETISTEEIYDVTLYARFIEIEKQNPIVLPDAKYHFTGTKYGTTWQPVLPTEAPAGVTNYTWTTSDSSIATVSMWSSITKKQNGYCVITATHNTDPSIVINGVFKFTADGIELSSVEEANKIEVCTVKFVGKDGEEILTTKCHKGGWAIPPLAPTYEGYKFVGWDKDYYNITEDTVIKAMYEDGTNKYTGKTFGIIGDSISTCSGYIPEGFAAFYPYPTADVDLPLTWWMKTITALGGTLFINNSYSGTCVSSGSSHDTKNVSRLQHLVIGNEAPDVILIYMGSNDCASQYVTVGQFTTGYKEMIDNLQKLCPNSEIVLCTLATSPFYTATNQKEYNDVIKKYANEYSLKLVDLAGVSLSGYLVDSAHPASSGMKLIADKVVEELSK